MAALMHQRVIFVLTHDSIGLGEDGPTHQAVEHLASLRLIPGLEVWRPADAVETRGRLEVCVAARERADCIGAVAPVRGRNWSILRRLSRYPRAVDTCWWIRTAHRS